MSRITVAKKSAIVLLSVLLVLLAVSFFPSGSDNSGSSEEGWKKRKWSWKRTECLICKGSGMKF